MSLDKERPQSIAGPQQFPIEIVVAGLGAALWEGRPLCGVGKAVYLTCYRTICSRFDSCATLGTELELAADVCVYVVMTKLVIYEPTDK